MEQLINQAFVTLSLIESTNSTTSKLMILNHNQNNKIFTDLLKRTYDPFTVYNIKKIDGMEYVNQSNSMTLESNYKAFLSLLDSLSTRSRTGNSAILACQSFFSHCSEIEAKWYTRVLKKDLNIGIKVKSINDAIPGLINVFQVMLAKELDRYPELIILEPKLDGLRLMGNTTTGQMFSRNGKQIEGFDSISEELKKLPAGHWIDGEILSQDKFNSTMTQVFRHTQGKQGILNAFDILTEDELDKGTSNNDQIRRTEHLEGLLLDIPLDTIQKVKTSGLIYTKNPDYTKEVDIFYRDCLEQGYEGIMVKDAKANYECKRTRNWQKMKPVDTFDIVVKNIEPGDPDTKYEYLLGRLVCDFNGNEVRIGSGLTDEMRMNWWNNPNDIIGKTIEVIAQEVTENLKGTSSLRFPRFKQVRLDK